MADNNTVDQEFEKVDMMISKIKEIVKRGSKREINDMASQILANLRNLSKHSKKDEFLYNILILLNKIASVNPSYRNGACQDFNDNLISMVENVKFEKKALQDVRKYLVNLKMSKDYDNLALSFSILIALLSMQTDRQKILNEKIEIWQSGISGIKYVPAETVSDNHLNTYEQSIEKALIKLK